MVLSLIQIKLVILWSYVKSPVTYFTRQSDGIIKNGETRQVRQASVRELIDRCILIIELVHPWIKEFLFYTCYLKIVIMQSNQIFS